MEKDSRIGGKSQHVAQKTLADKSSTGKSRKWNQYKKQSLAVSSAYRTFEGAGTFSKRMEDCGAWLRFLSCPSGHDRHTRLIGLCFIKRSHDFCIKPNRPDNSLAETFGTVKVNNKGISLL